MANLEDLKKAWHSDSGISQQRFEQISSKVRDSTELLQTTIFRRDMRETFATLESDRLRAHSCRLSCRRD